MKVFRIMSKQELDMYKKGEVIKSTNKKGLHYFAPLRWSQKEMVETILEIHDYYFHDLESTVVAVFAVNPRNLERGTGYYSTGFFEEKGILEFTTPSYSKKTVRLLATKRVRSFGLVRDKIRCYNIDILAREILGWLKCE